MPNATAIINLDIEGPKISRHLYGHFAEHLGRCVYGGFWVGEDSPIPNAGGVRLDVVEALRALRIPNLRWPGGCFADEYHWKDGIGPCEERPRMVNTHWGDVEENNHFGTHEFMALCELLGAEPYISGNVGSGTVREMSEWVEYLTRDGDSPMVRLRKENGREEPWRVRFWGIGNETWGCGGNMRAEYFADLARQYATYCRDHGTNKLYRIASGASDEDYQWTETLMRQINCFGCEATPRTYYQALSVHYYTLAGSWEAKGSATVFDTQDYYRTMVSARRVDRILTGHSTVMNCYDPRRTVGLVLDEWGTWWDVEYRPRAVGRRPPGAVRPARMARWAPWQGEGGWADADMLPLGRIGIRAERGTDRLSRRTRPEQISLLTLWLISRSPLMMGGDLPTSPPQTIELLTNDEALAVLMHSTGNREVLREGDLVLWAARDTDGPTRYAAVFSLAARPRRYEVPLGSIGARPADRVRELWTPRVPHDGRHLAVEVPAHGAALYRLAVDGVRPPSEDTGQE
ncbi:hypothetical protein ACWCQS_13915 [Streptomyces sp. NPDC002076]